MSARPRARRTASRSVGRSMLSSSTASTPMASASSSWASVSTSTSTFTMCPTLCAHAPHGLGDAAGERHVVVLDQHGVVEAVAVVAAAAHAHGVLLERAQAGRRLARAATTRVVEALEARHDVAGRGGDPAQVAEQVERGALAGEQRPRRARHARDHVARPRRRCRRGRRTSIRHSGSSRRKAWSAGSRPATRPAARATTTARPGEVRPGRWRRW